MDGVYETANTATVDLAKVGKVDIAGAGAACGGFVEFKTPGGTFAVSESNSKALKAWAEAPKKGNLPGIDTSKIKVYLRKDASDNPKIDVMAAVAMGYTLADLYKGGEGGTPLDPKLAEEMGQGVALLISKSDVKLRLEKAIGQDIDTNGTSDKNAAEECYKLLTLQYPVSYYKNKTPVSYTPDISATLTPTYWGSWNNDAGKIQFKINEQNFCKSSLMIINTNSDFGYWYNDTVTSLDEVNTDGLEANWNSFSNAKAGSLIQFIVGSTNGNIPLTTVFSAQANGVYLKYQADFDTTSYGNVSFRYDLGNDFAGNNIVSAFIPDGATLGLPVGMAGKATYDLIAPYVNPFLAQLGIGAGFTDTSWKDAVDGVRIDLQNPIIQETTNILLDLANAIGTLLQTRPDTQRPPIQNNMGNDQAGGDGT